MSEVFLRTYPQGDVFDKKEIFRYLGAKEPTDETKKLVDECIEECKGIFKYSVCFTQSKLSSENDTVHFEDFSLKSKDLSKNLYSCEKAVIFAATVGLGIDRLISKYSVISPAKAVIFQAIGAERIESLCDVFNEEMRLEYQKSGYSLKPRFSPGYGDLSLEVQNDIFPLLGCEKKLGITLGNSLLMSPSKSVTAIIGIYRK